MSRLPQWLPSIWLAMLGLACASERCRAQADTAAFRVVGIVWDSLRSGPLAGAFVSAAGQSTTTDRNGVFSFAALHPGPRVLSVQHAVLDSIGVPGIQARIVVSAGMDTLRVSVPTFRQLWNSACYGFLVARNRGFLFGSVRDAETDRPVANAIVRATWTDVQLGGGTRAATRSLSQSANTDSTGSYVLCSVPVDQALHVASASPSSTTGEIVVYLDRDLAVRRQDLSMGGAGTGTVIGTVTGADGRPLEGARVFTAAVAEVRTNTAGNFRIRDVPAGTQQIEVLALGALPVAGTVDVVPADTARIDFTMRKVRELDSVHVVANRSRDVRVREIDERLRMGMGHFRDSTELVRYPSLLSTMKEMPSVRFKQNGGLFFPPSRPGGAECKPYLWIDGLLVTSPLGVEGELALLAPDDIAMLEVYPRMSQVPMQFVVRNPKNPDCGVIVITTKRYLP